MVEKKTKEADPRLWRVSLENQPKSVYVVAHYMEADEVLVRFWTERDGQLAVFWRPVFVTRIGTPHGKEGIEWQYGVLTEDQSGAQIRARRTPKPDPSPLPYREVPKPRGW